MGGAAAVGVHDDLPAGEPGVALGAAHHEAAGGVDIDLGVVVHQAGGDGGPDDKVDDVAADLVQLHLGAVLGGDHHRVDAQGAVLLIVLHRDLGLSVGAQIVHQALLADLGQAAGQLLSQRDGEGHILLGLVTGVAEHHALVAGAVVQAVILYALLHLQAFVHAQGDVGGLLIDGGDHGTGVTIKAELGAVIPDVPHHIPGHPGDVHIAVGGDLAHHMDQAGGHRGLAGHTGHGVLLQDGVQHRVGDLVADLVGMPLGHRFRGKKFLSHILHSFLSWLQVKNAPPGGGAFCILCALIFRSIAAGFGTLRSPTGCRASSGRSLRHS